MVMMIEIIKDDDYNQNIQLLFREYIMVEENSGIYEAPIWNVTIIKNKQHG